MFQTTKQLLHILAIVVSTRTLYHLSDVHYNWEEGFQYSNVVRPKNVGLPQAAQVHKPQFTPHDPLATTCTSTFVNFGHLRGSLFDLPWNCGSTKGSGNTVIKQRTNQQKNVDSSC